MKSPPSSPPPVPPRQQEHNRKTNVVNLSKPRKRSTKLRTAYLAKVGARSVTPLQMPKTRFNALLPLLSPSLWWLQLQNYDEVFPLEDVIIKFGAVFGTNSKSHTQTHTDWSGYIIFSVLKQATARLLRPDIFLTTAVAPVCSEDTTSRVNTGRAKFSV